MVLISSDPGLATYYIVQFFPTSDLSRSVVSYWQMYEYT